MSKVHRTMPHAHENYELFMLGLSVYAVGAFAIMAVTAAGDPLHDVFAYADLGVCGAFLFDFVRSLRHAPSKLRYLVTWGWLDLLSSIPAVPFLRVGRAARIARVLRVLRAIRAGKILALRAANRRAQDTGYFVVFVCLVLVVVASVAVLHVEAGPDAHIRTAGDALWWAVVTLSTVGYGDLYPVSAEGRLIATMLMTAGVALFGTLTGLLASWFLSPDREAREAEVKDLREEIAALRRLLERRAQTGSH